MTVRLQPLLAGASHSVGGFARLAAHRAIPLRSGMGKRGPRRSALVAFPLGGCPGVIPVLGGKAIARAERRPGQVRGKNRPNLAEILSR